MNTRQSHAWDRQDGTGEDAPEAGAAGSRRSLLSVAVGGFALGASGLLLPDWLVEEVEAAEHPVRRVQHRAHKRRQRRQHRLKQKRRQQHDASGAPEAPGNFAKGVRLKVVAKIGPLQVQFRYGTFTWNNGGTVNIDTGGFETASTSDLNLGAYFLTDSGPHLPPAAGNLFIWASNPVGTPDVTVQNGNTFLLNHANLREEQTRSGSAALYKDLTVDFAIHRAEDSKDYKEFTLTVGPQR